MRASAGLVALCSPVALGWMASAGVASPLAPWAALPVAALAVVLAVVAPSAQRLRSVVWALVATTSGAAALMLMLR